MSLLWAGGGGETVTVHTVADKIAEWLSAKKISHAYGIVGAGNLQIFDSIARLQKTRLVCTHHEQAAGMAASFHWRASGSLAVAIVTTGAGSSNALTGVLAAFMDSSPLIVISGNEPSRALEAKTRVLGVQGYDSSAVASGVCKLTMRVHEADQVPSIFDYALEKALEPRMGPVWVDCPRDIQVQHV